jgi:glyoxylase-like metal-dependent hydrolase (beta-lactamase superfamily II)
MASPPLRETRVNDHVWVYTSGGEGLAESFGANCTAVIGDDAVLLVDPLIAPARARAVEEAVGRRTAAPVRFVVLTHHHTDHALGAGLFARRGIPVVAHRACRHDIARNHAGLVAERRRDPRLRPLFADAEPYLPPITIKNTLEIDLGGREVMAHAPGPGHTEGDLVVFLPSDRAAIAGDLVSNGYHVNYEDATLSNLRVGLEALAQFAPAVVIPGHGEVGGNDLVAKQAAYHVAIERIVQRGIAAGLSEDRIIEEIETAFPGHHLRIVLPETIARFRRLAESR